MTRILVTGGSGFIGKQLIQRLRNEPGVELFATKHANPLPGYIHCIDSSLEHLPSQIQAIRPNICINLASIYKRDEDELHLSAFVSANLILPASIIMSMPEGSTFINTNSYFALDQIWDMKKSLQGASKRSVEPYLEYFAKRRDIRINNLYLTDIFGPGDARDKFLPLAHKFFKGDTSDVKVLNPKAVIFPTHISDVIDIITKFAFQVDARTSRDYILSNGEGFFIESILQEVSNIKKLSRHEAEHYKVNLRVASRLMCEKNIDLFDYKYASFPKTLIEYLFD